MTAELALLPGRALGQSPQYWLNLPAAYDLKEAEVAIRGKLLNVVSVHPVVTKEGTRQDWRPVMG